MKKTIQFQEENYHSFQKGLNDFVEIFKDTTNELSKQGIEGYSYENLKQGNFLQIFESYHKKQQLKNDVTKNMIYEKFIDLYGYNTSELSHLEQKFQSFLNREYSFYSINNSFYNYCKTNYRHNTKLKQFLENAPNIKTYKVFDFVNIKGNNIKIDVPKELFTVYATNQRQLETINNIKEFVKVAKKLQMTSKDILEPLAKYLNYKQGGFLISGSKGLSEDLNTIDFDYNKILMTQ